MTVCQLAGLSAAAPILPCSLIDMEFDTDFLSMLMQAMLAGVALALMVSVWTDQPSVWPAKLRSALTATIW
jgi:hypothetical protein